MNNGQSELITQQLEEHEQESQSEHEDELEHADEQLGDTTATTLNSEVAKGETKLIIYLYSVSYSKNLTDKIIIIIIFLKRFSK